MNCILMKKEGINLVTFAKKIKTMKKIITIAVIIMVGLANAQAYKGKGDIKAQVGLNTQSHGTGINTSVDFGIG